MSQMDVVGADERRPTFTPFTLVREHQQALNVVGEELTVLASGAQTGSYEIFRQVGPEGSGPPPHTHPWDESFYVIDGEIMFSINDHEQSAEPGTLVHLPAGTRHWFRFGKGGGEMLSITSREAASRLFTDLDREISPDDPNFAKLVEVSVRHGMEILVPPS
jgi:quercetin dioxygenase-like cupin family protein